MEILFYFIFINSYFGDKIFYKKKNVGSKTIILHVYSAKYQR